MTQDYRTRPSFDEIVAPTSSRRRGGAPSGNARAARHIVDRELSPLLVVDQPIERRPWLEGVAVLAGLVLAVCLVAVVKMAGPDLPDVTTPPPATRALDLGDQSAGGGVAAVLRGGIGVPLRDGDIEFTVQGIRADPDGLLVAVLVRNVGKSSLPITSARQTLIDDGGRSYDPETVDDGGATSLEPGHSISQVLAFALTSGSQPATIQLSSGVGGAGVVVDLKQ